MVKKLLAVSLVLILLLTGCNYTDAWVEILNGDLVNTSFEVTYQMDEAWEKYFVNEAQIYGGEEAKLERQEQLGYKRAKVNVALDYKRRVGKLEVTVFNTFNPEKTKTMNFYVQGAKIFIPADLVTDRYAYYWTEEEHKRIQEAVQGKEYVMFNMEGEYGYHHAFKRLMTGNTFISLGEAKGQFEEIFWAKKGGDLEQLILFFKNLDTEIKKEGQDYILDLNFLEVVNQSEKVLCYMIDNVKEEDKAFINRYYDLDDEDFEEILENKEELKTDVQSGYDWIRESIEAYGLKPIFDASTIKAKWHLLKGANQEVEIKVVIPADIIKKYERGGPENRAFTATAKYIQNINKDSVVDIQLPSQYADGNELQKLDEKMQKEREAERKRKYEEVYEAETGIYEREENVRSLSYIWEKDMYYYSARELSGFFEEEISYKNNKLYIKRDDKNIEVKHKVVHDRAYVEKSVLENLGYTIEINGDLQYLADYNEDDFKYFIISKEDKYCLFTGKPVLQLILGENYEVRRSESDCKGLGWQVFYNGEEVMHRAADNELSYTYFMQEPGEYEIHVTKWITDGYETIGNVIKYTIE